MIAKQVALALIGILAAASVLPGPFAQTPPPPERLKYVEPVYPEAARAARIAGDVVIEAVIGPTGRITSATVVQSIPALDQAALDAVRQWEYTPTILDGAAVAVTMTVTVNFALEGVRAQDPTPQDSVVDPDALLADIRQESSRPDKATAVLWIPPEFLLAFNPGASPSEWQQLRDVLAPYLLLAVRDATLGPFGGVTLKQEAEVRGSTAVFDGQGNSYSPLDAADLGADLTNLLVLLQQMMRSQPGGEGTYFLVFPGIGNEGVAIANPRADGEFAVRVDGEDFTYRLPLESLLAPKFCPVDGQRLSGAWTYCPYHGRELLSSPPVPASP